LGTFTSLDDVAGQALNPATFNRFLYAEGNPETLTDPTGHQGECESIEPPYSAGCEVAEAGAEYGSAVLSGAAGIVEGALAWLVTHATPTQTIPNRDCYRACLYPTKEQSHPLDRDVNAPQDFVGTPKGKPEAEPPAEPARGPQTPYALCRSTKCRAFFVGLIAIITFVTTISGESPATSSEGPEGPDDRNPTPKPPAPKPPTPKPGPASPKPLVSTPKHVIAV